MTAVIERSCVGGYTAPATPAGVHTLVTACSPAALQRRFFLPVPLAPATVLALREKYLLAGPPAGAAVIAWRDGSPVGLLNLVVAGPGTVEAALLVADEWQRRRVGTCLLTLELRRPRWIGWRVTASVQPDNGPMWALLRRQRLGELQVIDRDPSAWDVAIRLPDARSDPWSSRRATRRRGCGGV